MTEKVGLFISDLGEHKSGWERDKANGEELTRLQRIGEKTHGVATISNFLSVGGAAAVVAGSSMVANGNHLGVPVLVGGLLLDVADGQIARRTGTESVLGRKVDAVSDGVKALGAATILMAGHVVPIPETIALFAPKAMNLATSAIAEVQHRNAETDLLDKTAEVGRWGVMAALVASHAFGWPSSEALTTISSSGSLVTWVSGLGLTSSMCQFMRNTGIGDKLERKKPEQTEVALPEVSDGKQS
ncbi:CDP-alcohol phosphatidyltransferase family protein [Candidatus Saccharibacteria bacterium]|nr:CDP-alcohol phosphatidyltransferase family protein [Candidatus Saccharibacteria bacterium]